jgi:hypothetical protein
MHIDTSAGERIREEGAMAASPRQPRRFTLADAMALVAAVALGLALSRVWTRLAEERLMSYSRLLADTGPLLWLTPFTFRAVQYWPVVAALSPTLLALRTRRPRPGRHRLFAPPGAIACAAATIAIALESLLNALAILWNSFYSVASINVLNLTMATVGALSSTTVGIAVAAAWGATALAGRWRPERTWIDRVGRVVGFLWLALIPIRLHLNHCCPYLSW